MMLLVCCQSVEYDGSQHAMGSPENFARVFRPNAALCDQLFELRIDGLQYISHPILCVREEGAAPPPSKTTVMRMFNVVIALIHEPALLR